MSRCAEATFSLTGEDGAEIIEGIEIFKYLGQLLDRSEDGLPASLRNTINE